ncbi:5-(carboxyamino)imidazole ribonucleotide synthase [Gloeomargarita sp.]
MHPTVGVLGGGQLAWLLAQAAQDLGIPLWVHTPRPDDPAVVLAGNHLAGTVIAAWDDPTGLAQLLTHCQVITFENEWVDLAWLAQQAPPQVAFRPSLASLSPLLDKYHQRCYVKSLGLPVPEFWLLRPEDSPPTLPLVVKARRHGYDGLGTRILHSAAELAALWRVWAVPDVLAEAYVPFVQELAVIAARHPQGDIAIYPVSRTYQAQQVCRWVYAPAPVPPAVVQTLHQHIRTLLTALDYQGVLATEWFYLADGTLLLNEIAPRTHNSGHYTLDACQTSQFHQHLRAITGQALGSTALTTTGALMVNLLGYETATGDYAWQRQQLSAWGRVYWYGKSQSRPGRKLGHVTLLDVPPQAIEDWVAQVESLWLSGGNKANLVE